MTLVFTEPIVEDVAFLFNSKPEQVSSMSTNAFIFNKLLI